MAEETIQTTENNSSEDTQTAAETAGKTFTQDEVNNLIKERLERERKSQPTKDELAEFRKWQDERKTAEQRTADTLKAAQDKQTAAEQRAESLSAQLDAIKKGVAPEAAEDVIALAQCKVSDTVTLSQAIDEVIKKYPQFAAKSEKPAGWGQRQNGVSGKSDGVEAAFLKRNPDIKI